MAHLYLSPTLRFNDEIFNTIFIIVISLAITLVSARKKYDIDRLVIYGSVLSVKTFSYVPWFIKNSRRQFWHMNHAFSIVE